jgi:hypothetical protein
MRKEAWVTFALFGLVASAGPITYTEQTTGSGSLGGSNFTNALVTLVLVGDTSTIYSDGPGVFRDLGTATVTVAGIGTTTFTDQMGFASIQAFPLAGIFDQTMGDTMLLATIDPSFATYSLGTAIGPVSNGLFYTPLESFSTTDGAFVITGTLNGTSTFTATTVPEPGSMALIGIGFASLFGFRRIARQCPFSNLHLYRTRVSMDLLREFVGVGRRLKT